MRPFYIKEDVKFYLFVKPVLGILVVSVVFASTQRKSLFFFKVKEKK